MHTYIFSFLFKKHVRDNLLDQDTWNVSNFFYFFFAGDQGKPNTAHQVARNGGTYTHTSTFFIYFFYFFSQVTKENQILNTKLLEMEAHVSQAQQQSQVPSSFFLLFYFFIFPSIFSIFLFRHTSRRHSSRGRCLCILY